MFEWVKSKFRVRLKVFNDGTRRWMLNRVLHRVDGPAVEYADGRKEWWLCGMIMFHEIGDCDPGKKYVFSRFLKWDTMF